ncbi:nucleotidyltransferase domain-containing protein [Streptosporangium sp. NPDC002721]|uniref:nucleotidyltransferase domain-containing protein n=1 Tax=Streptosporangium sp. NPDC002721 TaxID=3366188 RepID=UPI0036C76383
MPRTETPWGPWEPASPAEVVELFRGLGTPWWIGGGYAIELEVGHAYREHGDIDVGLLRRDQAAARGLLAGWDCWAADPPGTLRPWPQGEILPAGVHDIWVREDPEGPWRIQLMLDEADGDDWVYRRDSRIRRSLASFTVAEDGFSRIAPEIQLLYKAKGRRPKDERDFTEVLPRLDGARRAWLDEALATEHGTHPWRERLRPPE